MTGRSTEEWIGKTPDDPFPPRVRVRLFERSKGHCQICTRKIHAGERWIADHRIALCNGGQNRESNGQIICDWCDRKVKTPADVAEKAKVYAVRCRFIGATAPKARPLPGSKASGLRKRMNGTVERWPR